MNPLIFVTYQPNRLLWTSSVIEHRILSFFGQSQQIQPRCGLCTFSSLRDASLHDLKKTPNTDRLWRSACLLWTHMFCEWHLTKVPVTVIQRLCLRKSHPHCYRCCLHGLHFQVINRAPVTGRLSHLVALEARMVGFGTGQLSKAWWDVSSLDFGVEVPDRTAVLTPGCVRIPVCVCGCVCACVCVCVSVYAWVFAWFALPGHK